jgi:hypothetical protein
LAHRTAVHDTGYAIAVMSLRMMSAGGAAGSNGVPACCAARAL